MKGRSDAARLSLRGLRPLLGFEVMYKMAAVVLFVPLLLGTFSLVMRLKGYAYLTHENVGAFLTEPMMILSLAGLLVLAAAYGMTDVSAVAFALDQAARGVQVTQGQIFRFALQNTARLRRRGNILIVPAALLLVPFVNIGLAAGILEAVTIPAFLINYIKARPFLPPLAAVVLLLSTALGFYWRYAVFFFTAEGCGFAEARRKAAALGRRSLPGDLAVLLAVQAIFAGIYIVLLLLAIALARLLGKLIVGSFAVKWLGPSAVWLAIVMTLAVIAGLAVPVGYGSMGLLYHRRRAQAGLPEAHAPVPPLPAHPRRPRRLLKAAAACALTAGTVTLGFLLSTGGINPDIEHLHTMEITAHRGASALYPENTMAAFAGAMDLGADWIELDVQQSADGQLVVSHDANLKRTTGVNAYVWDLTYGEIAELDAGSSFGEGFAGERIPLLSDVLAFAKENGLHLNIELKPTGHEKDLERRVVDAILTAELEDACVVTSQVYSVLETVKAYNGSIPTVYVMRFAYGNIDRLDAADAFSVQEKSVTRALVSRVHNAGKGLYVWTVNTKRSINRMIELSVDNIITDNVDLAKQCVYESRYNDLLDEYADLLP